MYKREGGTADSPYDWEDTTRAKSVLGACRLSFSSIHSSGGFSDGQQISGGEEAHPNGPGHGTEPHAIPRRFHALEDSADFSDDSSARRRKRQTDLAAEQAALKPTTATPVATAATDDAVLTETVPPAKKKKKKRRCVIQ